MLFKVFDISMLVITVIPSLAVLWRLRTKGTSKDLKRTILYRNSFFLITYLIFVGSIILEVYDYKFGYHGANGMFKNNFAIRLVGIPLALVYMFEPYVFSVFR
jgi:hypothetical protein